MQTPYRPVRFAIAPNWASYAVVWGTSGVTFAADIRDAALVAKKQGSPLFYVIRVDDSVQVWPIMGRVLGIA